MKHTPGPWEHRQRYNALQDEIGIDGHALATVWVRKHKAQKDDTLDRVEPWESGEANARLIAAAPELLSNLEFAVKLLSGLPGMRGSAQVEHMRAVIAKASIGEATEESGRG